MSILIKSGGTWKDANGGWGTEITSGTASCTNAITADNYCKWVKSGHIVMVDIRIYIEKDSSVIALGSETFAGLPKPYTEIYLDSCDNNKYRTKYSAIDASDNFPFFEEYRLTVDGNLVVRIYRNGILFRDYFTYISSE